MWCIVRWFIRDKGQHCFGERERRGKCTSIKIPFRWQQCEKLRELRGRQNTMGKNERKLKKIHSFITSCREKLL